VNAPLADSVARALDRAAEIAIAIAVSASLAMNRGAHRVHPTG